jgi:hypothetical protein
MDGPIQFRPKRTTDARLPPPPPVPEQLVRVSTRAYRVAVTIGDEREGEVYLFDPDQAAIIGGHMVRCARELSELLQGTSPETPS